MHNILGVKVFFYTYTFGCIQIHICMFRIRKTQYRGFIVTKHILCNRVKTIMGHRGIRVWKGCGVKLKEQKTKSLS